MTTRKVFIGNRNAVEVVCPQCDKSLTIPVSRIQKLGAPIPARCTCGIQFSVVFERRANYRKSTGLQGRFNRRVGSDLQVGEAVVTNLSRSGLGLRVPASLNFDVGEILKVDFRLDNQEETLIRAQIVVKNFRSGHIGAEFHSLDEHTRKLLGFYLMP
jgi:hypothetical protein